MSAKTTPEGVIIIKGARLSYPKLHQPEAIKNMQDSKPRYGCQLLIPKSDKATMAAIKAEVDRLCKIHFKGKKPENADLFYTDGDGVKGDEHSEGCIMVSANRAESQNRPLVIDRAKNPVQPGDEEDPYAGCYVNAKIGVYRPKGWAKICASLEVVQFAKHGEPIGAGKPVAGDEFDDLSDDEDGNDLGSESEEEDNDGLG